MHWGTNTLQRSSLKFSRAILGYQLTLGRYCKTFLLLLFKICTTCKKLLIYKGMSRFPCKTNKVKVYNHGFNQGLGFQSDSNGFGPSTGLPHIRHPTQRWPSAASAASALSPAGSFVSPGQVCAELGTSGHGRPSVCP